MSRAIRLRPLARTDLQGIWRFTLDQWGAEQAETYAGAIDNEFRKLADNPRLGSDQSSLHPGLRKSTVGSHCIYYLFDDHMIDVVRILHNRRDVAAAL